MGGVSSLSSDSKRLVYFTESARDRGSEYLAAVVVWRHRRRSASGRRWTLLRNVWPWVIRGEPGPATWRAPDGWSAWSRSAEEEGEREVLLRHDERRLLRVLDLEYALPDADQTLVVLIDEPKAPGQAAVVATFTLDLPTAPRPVPDRSAPRSASAERFAADYRRNSRSWQTLLLAEPRIRDFWEHGQYLGRSSERRS